MQISGLKYQNPSLLLYSSAAKNASTVNQSFPNSETSNATIQNSGSSVPTSSGNPAASLQAALARGMVNPIDYLSSSDKALIQKTTGATIKNGEIYDAQGNLNETQDTSDLINTLYELRNYGVPSKDKMSAISGDVTADDLAQYIKYYENGAGEHQINRDVLEEAIAKLTTNK